mgnify:CR=1 FL=1
MPSTPGGAPGGAKGVILAELQRVSQLADVNSDQQNGGLLASVDPVSRTLSWLEPIARVLPMLSVPHLDREFDYLVSAEHSDDAQPGVRVRVRFHGRLVDAFVLERPHRHEAIVLLTAECTSRLWGEQLNVEQPGDYRVSGAEYMLEQL